MIKYPINPTSTFHYYNHEYQITIIIPSSLISKYQIIIILDYQNIGFNFDYPTNVLGKSPLFCAETSHCW